METTKKMLNTLNLAAISKYKKLEYFLYLILNFLYASIKALSDGEFSYLDNKHECCLSSPMQDKL